MMAKISYAAIFALILIISVFTAARAEGVLCLKELYLNPCRASLCNLICVYRYQDGQGLCAKRKSHDVCICVYSRDCPS
ncbi:uncharacterized protein DS421_17g580410 [Arachis hypogaea]|nr:uncharacterized protein DS421_17g580410 [Arachis hypogaea]